MPRWGLLACLSQQFPVDRSRNHQRAHRGFPVMSQTAAASSCNVVMVGCSPQTAQRGLRFTFTLRKSMRRAFHTSRVSVKRPSRPKSDFRASVACKHPTTPATAPNTPPANKRHSPRRRRLVENTPVARTDARPHSHQLAVETQDAGMGEGFVAQDAGVVDEKLRRKVVGAVDHKVVVLDQVQDVAGLGRRWNSFTVTSGLMARNLLAADVTLSRPMSSVWWIT